MFLQGSVETNNAFIIKELITALKSPGKKCLICGTAGNAVIQCPGGTTLRSLFRLGIDERFSGVSCPISTAILFRFGISLPHIWLSQMNYRYWSRGGKSSFYHSSVDFCSQPSWIRWKKDSMCRRSHTIIARYFEIFNARCLLPHHEPLVLPSVR
jgi:hypothetical protein